MPLLHAVTAAVLSWIAMKWCVPQKIMTAIRCHSSPSIKISHKKTLVEEEQLKSCEGYWPATEECISLGTTLPSQSQKTQSNALCPQWLIHPEWKESRRRLFSQKLRQIEETAKDWEECLLLDMENANKQEEEKIITTNEAGLMLPQPVQIIQYRGLAWSRMEDGEIAGNSEFHAAIEGEESGEKTMVCWTDALLPLYVDKYGVEPSKEFQAFVAAFNANSFRDELGELCRRKLQSNNGPRPSPT